MYPRNHSIRPNIFPNLSVGTNIPRETLFSHPHHGVHSVFSKPTNGHSGVFIHNDDLEEVIIHTPHTPPLRYPPTETKPVKFKLSVTIGNIKLPLSLFVAICILLTIMAVGASIVHNLYSDITCVGSYKGVPFGYVKWLYIYAWTNIGCIGTMIWLFAVSRISNIKVDSLKSWVLVMGYLFQFAWYIIGSILYFIEINKPCSKGDVLYDFGLGLFICQTVLWFTIFFQDRRS